MSAEAADPGALRRRSRPRIDLRRLGRVALRGPVSRDRLPDAISHVAEAHRAHHPDADLTILRRACVLAESRTAARCARAASRTSRIRSP